METVEQIPVWAFVLLGVLSFSLGFEAGRAFTWLHHLWRERHNG